MLCQRGGCCVKGVSVVSKGWVHVERVTCQKGGYCVARVSHAVSLPC